MDIPEVKHVPTDEKTTELLDTLSKEAVAPYVQQKEYIYIDVEMLYDFKLGAVIGLSRNKEEFDYIFKTLPEYLASSDFETAKHFPKCDLKEETLYKFLQDPVYNRLVSLTSPPTSLIEDLRDVIAGYNTVNTSKETKRPLKITINQTIIKLHQEAKDRLVDYIKSIDPHIQVRFTEYTWDTIPKEEIITYDLMIVYDIVEFLRENTVSQHALAIDKSLSQTTITTYKRINTNCTDKEDQAIANFVAIMSMLCDNFIVLDKALITKG